MTSVLQVRQATNEPPSAAEFADREHQFIPGLLQWQVNGVPLNTDAVLLVRQRLGKHPTHVFSYRGKPITQVCTKVWYAALRNAGIEDFRWHDLRHTWASWLVQAGTPPFALQEMGGWSSAEMVRRYAYLAADHLAPFAERLFTPLTAVPETLGTNWSQSAK